MSPIPFGGALVRGVRRPVKPYTPHPPGRGIMLGLDTETLQAEGRAHVYTIQIAHAKGSVVEPVADASACWRVIVDQLRAVNHHPDDGPVVLWAYNLNFDLLWLLGREHWRVLAGGSYSGKVKALTLAGGAVVGLKSFVYGRVAFAELNHRGYHFLLRDLRLWWAGGLGDLAPLLGSRKLATPRGLGRVDLLGSTRRVRESFIEYARHDAVLALRAGYVVKTALTKLGIWSFAHVPVSAAHAASLIYRKGLSAPIPSARTFPALRASLYAFAGGRAGATFRGTWPHPVTSYDVNSMYPWAMLQLPEPAGWECRAVKEWAGADAIYLVDGVCTDRSWPGLVERDREGRMWSLVGRVHGAWVSGYELESFRKHGDGELVIRQGFAYRATRPQTSFPAFVGALYPLRSSGGAATRALAKTILNSLSGKFIEHHSRFALPHGLRFKVAAPKGFGKGYGREASGAFVTAPDGTRHQLEDEWYNAHEVADFDSYIARCIDAFIDGNVEEISVESRAHFKDGWTETVNLEYITQDAGGSFAPEVATLILGKARARLHDLMHEHRAVYWDTDSIMVEDEHRPKRSEIGAGIGQLKVEGGGILHVARPKLYYLTDPGGAVTKIANAGIPDTVPEADRVKLIDGERIRFAELRGITPGTSHDRTLRDVGTFETVQREAVAADDPRYEYIEITPDYAIADARPMPWSVRSPGRLRFVAEGATV